MTVPETGFRRTTYTTTKPAGATKIDLSQGVKNWHVIPPVAIWERGKWFDQLDQTIQEALPKVDPVDERETWVVSGEGTPGDWLLRVYLVPIKVAEFQECKHPKHWTKKQREEGDNKKVSGVGYNWSGYSTPSNATKAPTPPKPPPLPTGIHFRCVMCGHWFGSETKLSGHSTHCCPGSANWGEEGADWVLECECCATFHDTSVCLPGFPRPKKEPVKTGDEKKEVAV